MDDMPTMKLSERRRNMFFFGQIGDKNVNFLVLAKLDRNFSPAETAELKDEILKIIRETIHHGVGFGPVYAKLCVLVNSSQIEGKSKLTYKWLYEFFSNI